MIAMGLRDMVLKWETREESRVVGCMKCRMGPEGLIWLEIA